MVEPLAADLTCLARTGAVVTLYFDDFRVNAVFDCGTRQISKNEIVEFAREFDPQPFHTDDDHPVSRAYGGLIASGWHTAALTMRQVVIGLLRDTANLGSSGVEKLRFLKPLHPGDTIRVTVRAIHAAPSQSRPDRGRVTFTFETHNQNDELILDLSTTVIFNRRLAGTKSE